jgi:hypothetical protein
LFFYKIREQEGRACPALGFGTSGSREDVGRACRRVNMVPILCTHVCKWKNEVCLNYPKNGKKRGKEE